MSFRTRRPSARTPCLQFLLLKRGYLEVPYFENKFGVNIIKQWQSEWDKYQEDGWATVQADRIELTRYGLLRVDAMLPAFFEPEHQNVRYT